MSIYEGKLLNPSDMENGPIKNAYVSYREQRTRCYNKKREKYKYYGEKGIEVKYSSGEFIGWWLEEIKSFKGKDPTISRIDHSKNYEFGNIKIESRSDNTIERNKRILPFHKAKKVMAKSKAESLLFLSVNSCSVYFGVLPITMSNIIKNKSELNGYTFNFTGVTFGTLKHSNNIM